MTISNTSRTAGPFIGNGITKTFPFSYKVFDRSDVLVAQTVTATGVETLKVLDADYSVALNVDQNNNPGGIITMFVAPPVGTTLAATSNIALVQSLDLTNQGGFYPKVINDALDRLVMNVQQLAGKIGNGLGIGMSAITDQALAALALVQQIGGAAGGTLIGFLQTGVGAILRNMLSKAQERISVLDYGADPTGQTSSSDAIQKAIVAARLKSGNSQSVNQGSKTAIVYFPPGSYLMDKKVLVPMNTTLRGDGATILCWSGGANFETGYYNGGVLTSTMTLTDAQLVPNNVLSGVRFENLTFYGGDLAINMSGVVWNSGVFNCSFYNVHIAIKTRFCFYPRYEHLTIRGDNPDFNTAAALIFGSNSNRIEVSNVSIASRDRGILLGEPGAANISGQFSFNNSSIEGVNYGVEFSGTIKNFHAHDIYLEEVSSVFLDADGALKYNFNIHDCYSYSTAYFVDLSGLRDSFIGQVRDWSPLASVKAAVRLRQGTYGNTAVVEMSNLEDPDAGSNRYQVSNGVILKGVLSKYTGGAYSVLLKQDLMSNITISQYAGQVPVLDQGWYGEVGNFIIGTTDGILHPVNGTEPYIITKMFWSEHTALSYSIKITPAAGSGAGGTTPAPIYLKGIVMGSHATQIVANSMVAYSFRNGSTGTFQIAFGEFGVNNTDPAFAWMRNGQFTAEGIVKLIA
jgi:hypothetical protein